MGNHRLGPSLFEMLTVKSVQNGSDFLTKNMSVPFGKDKLPPQIYVQSSLKTLLTHTLQEPASPWTAWQALNMMQEVHISF